MTSNIMTQLAPEDNVVLVTGGSGLVGQTIRDLVEANYMQYSDRYKFFYLSRQDGDLTSYEQTKAIFDKYKPKYVINLAAKVGGLYANMRENELFYSENTAINNNVLQNALESKVRKCISCLSTCIFPEKIEYPLNESKIHLGPPSETNSGYSRAKRQVDIMNREFSKKSNGQTLFTAVIPTNIYGKYDNFNIDRAHVIPCLIHRAYSALMDKIEQRQTLEVYGSGQALRQFIYAPDLAKLILWALDKYQDAEPIIMCPDSREEFSIKEVAEYIADAFFIKTGSKLKLTFNLDYNDGQLRKTASNAKLRTHLPNFNFVDIKRGIAETVFWFCNNYNSVRK